MTGLARAAGRHQLAGPDSGHRRPDRKHGSCRRVPQRQVLGEPAADGLPGGRQAVGPCLLYHLADQVGPSTGLSKQAGLG